MIDARHGWQGELVAEIIFTLAQVGRLAQGALELVGANATIAASVARSTVRTGLLFELLVACKPGVSLSKFASLFSDIRGGLAEPGQYFITLVPLACFSSFAERIDRLSTAITDQVGARLPCMRRYLNRQQIDLEGVVVAEELVFRICEIGEYEKQIV